jgi:hypothetical protein
MVLLSKIFIGSMLEYDSVCHSGQNTYYADDEKSSVPWNVDSFNPNFSLEVLSSILLYKVSMTKKFIYLNLR